MTPKKHKVHPLTAMRADLEAAKSELRVAVIKVRGNEPYAAMERLGKVLESIQSAAKRLDDAAQMGLPL